SSFVLGSVQNQRAIVPNANDKQKGGNNNGGYDQYAERAYRPVQVLYYHVAFPSFSRAGQTSFQALLCRQVHCTVAAISADKPRATSVERWRVWRARNARRSGRDRGLLDQVHHRLVGQRLPGRPSGLG